MKKTIIDRMNMCTDEERKLHYQCLCANGHLNYLRIYQLKCLCSECESELIWSHEFTQSEMVELEVLKEEVPDICPHCNQDYIKEKTIYKIPIK